MIERKIRFESIVMSDDDELRTHFISDSVMHFSEGRLTQIDFSEPMEDDLFLETTILLEDESVKIQRQGHVAMEQHFILDEEVEGTYETDYGSFTTTSVTNVLEIDCSVDAGEIYFEYDFYLNYEKVSTIRILIEY